MALPIKESLKVERGDRPTNTMKGITIEWENQGSRIKIARQDKTTTTS